MTSMSQSEKEAFLADLHVGVVGINDPERGPLTVPIWYDYTPGETLWMVTGSNSRKGKLLEVGTRVSLAAQSEELPYKYVSVEGPVSRVEPCDEKTLRAMAIRYLGEEMGASYAEGSGIEGQVIVHVTPERWLAVDYGKT